MTTTKITIKDVDYFIRDIEWEDLPNLNLYGLMLMSNKQEKIKLPYINTIIEACGFNTPYSKDEREIINERIEHIFYSEKDQTEFTKIEMESIGLFNPFLRAMVIKPDIRHIKPSVGIELLRHPMTQQIIHDTIKDIMSVMKETSDDGTPSEKKQ